MLPIAARGPPPGRLKFVCFKRQSLGLHRPRVVSGPVWGKGGAMAAVGDLDRPWEFNDPRRDRAMIPYTDECSAAVIEAAAVSLVLMRAPMWLGDAGPTVSVLVSLGAAAYDALYDAVADARDQDYTWDQIAGRLAMSATAARRRYAGYAGWRRGLPLDWD